MLLSRVPCKLMFGLRSSCFPLRRRGRAPWLKPNIPAATLLLLPAKIGSDRAQVVIEPLGMLLSDLAYLFNDWIFPHELPLAQLFRRTQHRRLVSLLDTAVVDRAAHRCICDVRTVPREKVLDAIRRPAVSGSPAADSRRTISETTRW